MGLMKPKIFNGYISRMNMPLRLVFEKHRILLMSAALVVLTSAAFEGLRGNAFVKFGDPEYITENVRIQSGLTPDGMAWAFTSGHAANWQPLTWISHMLDTQLFGLRPAGHHLHSLVLHILATLLLFWVLRSMTGLVWPSAFVAMAFGFTRFTSNPSRGSQIARTFFVPSSGC